MQTVAKETTFQIEYSVNSCKTDKDKVTRLDQMSPLSQILWEQEANCHNLCGACLDAKVNTLLQIQDDIVQHCSNPSIEKCSCCQCQVKLRSFALQAEEQHCCK
jgi:hypothetical protein